MPILLSLLIVSFLLIPTTIATLHSIALRLRQERDTSLLTLSPLVISIIRQLVIPVIILLLLVGISELILVDHAPALEGDAPLFSLLTATPLLHSFNDEHLLWIPNLGEPDSSRVLPFISALLISSFGAVMVLRTQGPFGRALKLYLLMLIILSVSIGVFLASGPALTWIFGSVVILTFQYSFALSIRQ